MESCVKQLILTLNTQKILTFIIALILRIMGPKYLETIPILIVLMIANVNAMPQNMRPTELKPCHNFKISTFKKRSLYKNRPIE